jgi:hypothetical protein
LPDALAALPKRPKSDRSKGSDDHERVMRVEAMLEQLVQKSSGDGNVSAVADDGWKSTDFPTPSSLNAEAINSQPSPCFSDVRLALQTSYTKVIS